MREERLLERIRSWEKAPDRRTREDPAKIVDSVLGHLRRILNTRRGNVPISEDYGIPDFTDFLRSYPESVRDIERTIRQIIQDYEPRLTSIRVSFIPQEEDLFSVNFHISARLATEDDRVPVVFESYVGSDGRVNIKG
ncbi:MAG: type VI secretion system baseplate subunit TssE [Deltaproteobacteria bacterium]|nr:MAG: type VI secretion system baseplate subunit TssE [Deltaproteobacteria bacterium]